MLRVYVTLVIHGCKRMPHIAIYHIFPHYIVIVTNFG